MRERLCKVCGQWHRLEAWPAACWSQAESKSARFPVPMFISDSIKPVQSQVDGKTYDSRSALYAHYESSGVRVLDAGEKTTRPEIKKTTDADILPSLQKAGVI